MYALLCLKWITNTDLLYSTGNSVQCYVAAWMGGEFRGKWMRLSALASRFFTTSATCVCLLTTFHTALLSLYSSSTAERPIQKEQQWLCQHGFSFISAPCSVVSTCDSFGPCDLIMPLLLIFLRILEFIR